MLSTLDCIPCFLKQALYAARLTGANHEIQKKILDEVAQLLPDLDMALTPPENSIAIYELISRITACADPFAELKRESNELALNMRDDIRRIIQKTDQPLSSAIKFSIAGNIIDYGAHQDFDIQQTIDSCLARELAINDFAQLVSDLKKAKNILYLGDNSGEIVFDSLVIEQLEGIVTFAVKERPIINDALATDARACGLDKICDIISNGTACPGTPLRQCSAKFQEKFAAADLIISKGQGNFETLSEVSGPIYFLLTVKCPVIAGHINEISSRNIANGDMILMKSAA
jgi:uncharacterized protein with ATP-grasp and redox domains